MQLDVDLIVATLEAMDGGGLEVAKRLGRVRLTMDASLGRAALYAFGEAKEPRLVGYVKSRQVAEHLRSGGQAYARLNDSITDEYSITCTLIDNTDFPGGAKDDARNGGSEKMSPSRTNGL